MGRIVKTILLATLIVFFAAPASAAIVTDYDAGCCDIPPYAACCPDEPGTEPISCISQSCGPTEADQNGTCQRVCIDETGQSVGCTEGGAIKCVHNPETTAGTTDTGTLAPIGPPILPILSIDIPTVRFSDIEVRAGGEGGGRTIDIPWIAEYIAGVYRYAVYVASLLAAVMMMIGGIQWLTAGGNASSIGAAKTRIINALVGLILVLGSYIVLNAINPALVSMRALRVTVVERNLLEAELQTTTTDTGSPEPEGNTTPPYQIASGRGTYRAQYFTSCPVNLQNSLPARFPDPNRDPRTIEFIQEVMSQITGTPGEKFAKLFEAAWLCGVHFGSCGRTASTLAVLATEGAGAECLQPDYTGNRGLGCMDQYDSTSVFSAGGADTLMRGRSCNQARATASCYQDRNEAISTLFDHFQNAISGYPETYTDRLQPGDIITIYNANSDAQGGHRAVFMGWAGNGQAQFLNGAYGRVPYATDTCITTRCGRPAPVIRAQRIGD